MKHERVPLITLVLLSVAVSGCGEKNLKPDGSGTIEATEVRVAPEVGGRLAAVMVQEGDIVAPSQVVARIDAALLKMKRDEARAAENMARAQLDLVKAGSRGEDILRARAQVKEATAAAWAASQDWTRVRDVFAKGSVSAKQADDAKAMADRTAAAQAAAEQALERIERGNRQQELDAAMAALDVASARVAQAEKALRDTSVVAPIGGVVRSRPPRKAK